METAILDEAISVVRYDPLWPAQFERERDRVHAAQDHSRLLGYAKEKRPFIIELAERARRWQQGAV